MARCLVSVSLRNPPWVISLSRATRQRPQLEQGRGAGAEDLGAAGGGKQRTWAKRDILHAAPPALVGRHGVRARAPHRQGHGRPGGGTDDRVRGVAIVLPRTPQDERRRPAPRDSGACGRCWIAPRPTRGDLLEARTSSHAASAHVAVPRQGDARGAQLVGGCGSALGLRVGQVIVKLFFAGVGSAPAALNARTSNVYLPGFRCL
jgi:hypothetical protein